MTTRKARQKQRAARCAALSDLYKFYFNELSGINMQRLFREVGFCFVVVVGFARIQGLDRN
jgi:hypothetical protein